MQCAGGAETCIPHASPCIAPPVPHLSPTLPNLEFMTSISPLHQNLPSDLCDCRNLQILRSSTSALKTMRPLARSCNFPSPLSARRVSAFASKMSTNNFKRVIPYAGPFHPKIHPTLRGLRGLSNGNTNISTTWTDIDSLLSQILRDQKRQQRGNWIAYGFSGALAVTLTSYVDNEKQEHQDRVNQQLQQQHQQLQQQLQQEQKFSSSQIFILESVKDILAKRLSEWSGESEEAIMSSAVKQTQQTTIPVEQEQALGAMEAERTKSTKV